MFDLYKLIMKKTNITNCKSQFHSRCTTLRTLKMFNFIDSMKICNGEQPYIVLQRIVLEIL